MDMLRLLLLEDDAPSAELTLRALQSEGLPCACERVASEVEFRAALERAPDVVLSDSNVPGFAGLAALAITKSERPETPFIFLSGHLDEAAIRRALEAGATACLSKMDLGRLPGVVRSAVPAKTRPLRRVSDPPHRRSLAEEAEDSVDYLLQRQAAVERSLRHPGSSRLSNVLSHTPPAPAALVMIDSATSRDRYLKLLSTVDIDVDVAADAKDALQRLATRIHALLFTDQLELIREARQLNTGSAVHMIFIYSPGEGGASSDGLRVGANDVMPADGRGEEFWSHLAIARRIVSFAASLQTAITDNRLLSTIDELTRVGNRRYFEHQWPREVAQAVRFRRPLSLVMCDIDHFKTINDQHGHPVGDEVLAEFGERLTQGLRLGEDWVARVGGEEFAIVLPETGRLQARVIAERLRDCLSGETFLSTRLALTVTASFGCCTVEGLTPRVSDLSERLVRLADGALYDSKRAGRNRVTEAMLSVPGTNADV
jgi:two-component system cell cycle response regulator